MAEVRAGRIGMALEDENAADVPCRVWVSGAIIERARRAGLDLRQDRTL
jgi:hypothetical protein